MPSRHTASFTVIAMTWLYVNPAAGVIMLVLAFLMGVVSVLGGVHFVKDVLAGAQYLRIIFLGLMFTFLYNFFSSTLRALGDSASPLYFLIISAVLKLLW